MARHDGDMDRFIAEGTGSPAGDDLLGRMLRMTSHAGRATLGWIRSADPSDAAGRLEIVRQERRFSAAVSDIMPSIYTGERWQRESDHVMTIPGIIGLIRSDENGYVAGMGRIMDTVESSFRSIRHAGLRATYAMTATRMLWGCAPHPGDPPSVAWGRMILNVKTHGRPGGSMGDTPLGTVPGPGLLDEIMEPSVLFAIEDMWISPSAPVSPMTALLTMEPDGTVGDRVRRITDLENELRNAIESVSDRPHFVPQRCFSWSHYWLLPFGFGSLETMAGLDAWRASLLLGIPFVVGSRNAKSILFESRCDPSMTGAMDSYIASTDWTAPPSSERMFGVLSDMLTDADHPCDLDTMGTLRRAMDSVTGATHGGRHVPAGTPADMLLHDALEDPDIMRSFMILDDLIYPIVIAGDESGDPVIPLSVLMGAAAMLDDGLPERFVAESLPLPMRTSAPPGHRTCRPRPGSGVARFIIDIDG